MTHETAEVKCLCSKDLCPCCDACVCKGNKDTAAVMSEFSHRELGVE